MEGSASRCGYPPPQRTLADDECVVGFAYNSTNESASQTQMTEPRVEAGGFQPAPGGMEERLFARTPEDAAAFGRLLYAVDSKQFTVVQATLPTDLGDILSFNQHCRGRGTMTASCRLRSRP